MKQERQFHRAAAARAADDAHRHKILKAITTYNVAVAGRKQSQFHQWRQAAELAAAIKSDVLARLPDLLVQFEAKATAAGAKVFWAETAADAREYILRLAQRHGARRVVKSKSMTTEEVGLNEALEARGIEVWESDLGELIVQLAGEKPYHIVTPAMHKSRQEIARLFQEKLDAPATEDAETLTLAARNHLRRAYTTAELGITGANFLIAEEGAIVVTENEGNARLTMACPPVHVAIAGIEKVLRSLDDLALFLPLLATSGTGQQLTCYNSIVRGPRAADEPDGPREMHIILLDNGRSRLYADAEFRQSLRCIRCGACLNACPVYRTIGGHAYATTYQGPIGSVITPHLRDFPHWAHLPFASSLCGACTEVCPVRIDLHHLLLGNRARAVQQSYGGRRWRIGMRMWATVMKKRERLERARSFARLAARLARPFFSKIRSRRIPQPAAQSFAAWWKQNEGEK